MPTTYVALLRGVNVGGKNKLPMKDLGEMFVAAGCRDVRTFIQSGNVLFCAAPALVKRLPGLIAERIAERFGYKTPVVLRSAVQLEAVLGNNPFLGADGVTEDSLHVMFLADTPGTEAVGGLDLNRSPPDRFVVRGGEIYLQLPNGAGKSKLTNAYFDSKLRTVSTGRNWRTVTKLRELMG